MKFDISRLHCISFFLDSRVEAGSHNMILIEYSSEFEKFTMCDYGGNQSEDKQCMLPHEDPLQLEMLESCRPSNNNSIQRQPLQIKMFECSECDYKPSGREGSNNTYWFIKILQK